MAATAPDAPSPEMTSASRELTEVVTRLRRTLRTSIRTDYPWESLPMARVELLMALQERQPLRVGELANLLRLAPNTVSGLVQALVEAGLVTRVPDPSDRRVAVVGLTPAGCTELAGWERAHQQRLGHALGGLPAAEQASILAALPALALLVDHLATPGFDEAARSGPGSARR